MMTRAGGGGGDLASNNHITRGGVGGNSTNSTVSIGQQQNHYSSSSTTTSVGYNDRKSVRSSNRPMQQQQQQQAPFSKPNAWNSGGLGLTSASSNAISNNSSSLLTNANVSNSSTSLVSPTQQSSSMTMNATSSSSVSSSNPVPAQTSSSISSRLRRPFVQLVVLFASDPKVMSYAQNVQASFLKAGADVWLMCEMVSSSSTANGGGSSDFASSYRRPVWIKPENLVEVINGSFADCLIVIGDRNMKNETCQAQKKGKLKEMAVEDRIRELVDDWTEKMGLPSTRDADKSEFSSLAYVKDASRISEAQILGWIREKLGICSHAKERVERLKETSKTLLSWSKLRMKKAGDSSATVFSDVDQDMITKLTSSQTAAVRFHKELVQARDLLISAPLLPLDEPSSMNPETMSNVSHSPSSDHSGIASVPTGISSSSSTNAITHTPTTTFPTPGSIGLGEGTSLSNGHAYRPAPFTPFSRDGIFFGFVSLSFRDKCLDLVKRLMDEVDKYASSLAQMAGGQSIWSGYRSTVSQKDAEAGLSSSDLPLNSSSPSLENQNGDQADVPAEIQSLVAMGFPVSHATFALNATNGNVELALNELLSGAFTFPEERPNNKNSGNEQTSTSSSTSAVGDDSNSIHRSWSPNQTLVNSGQTTQRKGPSSNSHLTSSSRIDRNSQNKTPPQQVTSSMKPIAGGSHSAYNQRHHPQQRPQNVISQQSNKTISDATQQQQQQRFVSNPQQQQQQLLVPPPPPPPPQLQQGLPDLGSRLPSLGLNPTLVSSVGQTRTYQSGGSQGIPIPTRGGGSTWGQNSNLGLPSLRTAAQEEFLLSTSPTTEALLRNTSLPHLSAANNNNNNLGRVSVTASVPHPPPSSDVWGSMGKSASTLSGGVPSWHAFPSSSTGTSNSSSSSNNNNNNNNNANGNMNAATSASTSTSAMMDNQSSRMLSTNPWGHFGGLATTSSNDFQTFGLEQPSRFDSRMMPPVNSASTTTTTTTTSSSLPHQSEIHDIPVDDLLTSLFDSTVLHPGAREFVPITTSSTNNHKSSSSSLPMLQQQSSSSSLSGISLGGFGGKSSEFGGYGVPQHLQQQSSLMLQQQQQQHSLRGSGQQAPAPSSYSTPYGNHFGY